MDSGKRLVQAWVRHCLIIAVPLLFGPSLASFILSRLDNCGYVSLSRAHYPRMLCTFLTAMAVVSGCPQATSSENGSVTRFWRAFNTSMFMSLRSLVSGHKVHLFESDERSNFYSLNRCIVFVQKHSGTNSHLERHLNDRISPEYLQDLPRCSATLLSEQAIRLGPQLPPLDTLRNFLSTSQFFVRDCAYTSSRAIHVPNYF